jgi:hypothetical protein
MTQRQKPKKTPRTSANRAALSVLVKKRSGKLDVEEEAEEADEFLLRALSNWEELKTSGGIGEEGKLIFRG